MSHILHVHHAALSNLTILLGLHHIHGSLTGDHIRILQLLHLAHVHLRVVAMKHGSLAAEVGHSDSILHGASRSGRSWIRRHTRGHGTTLGDLRTRHGRMHSSHHSRIWLAHVSAVLNLHGVAMGHTWVSRTHARLGGVWTCLHHICDGYS